MSDSAGILQEYLISVGVKADENSLGKLNKIFSSTEKIVTALTGSLAAGIAAVESFVAVSTNELDDLYWATKRLKSSAGDIKDFELRMSKAGLATEDARAALETLAQFRRTNPAGDSFLGLMGIQAQGKGSVAVMEALVNRFKQLNQQGQYWLAVRFGERLGLDERTVWSMVNTSTKAETVYDRMYKKLGINQEQAMKNAHEYRNRLRDLNAEFTVVSQTIGLKLMPMADRFLEWLMHSQEAENLGHVLLGLTNSVADLAVAGGNLLAVMPQEALEFGIVGYFLFGKKGALLLGMVGAVSHMLDKMVGDENKVNEKYIKAAGEDDQYKWARWRYEHGLGYLNTNEFNTTYAEYQYRKRHPKEKPMPDDSTQAHPSMAWGRGAGAERGPRTLGVRSNNPGNLQPGGREKVYSSPQEGMKAMAGLLLRYGRQGLNSIEQIVNKYAPPSANDTRAYIARVAKEMGVAPSEPLRLTDPEVLRKLMAAMIRVEQGYQPWGMDMIAQGVQAALGTPAQAEPRTPGGSQQPQPAPQQQPRQPHEPQPAPRVAQAGERPSTTPSSGDTRPQVQKTAALPASMTAPRLTPPNLSTSPMQPVALGDLKPSKTVVITQGDTNVTIHGAKDPKETGKQVQRVTDRRNGDIIRNLSPAVL